MPRRRRSRRTAGSARHRLPGRPIRSPPPTAASARGTGLAAAPSSGTSARSCTASPAAGRGASRARDTRGRWAPCPPDAASASARRGPRTCTSPSGRRQSPVPTSARTPTCLRTRRLDPPVAVEAADVLRRPDHVLPGRLLGGEDVMRSRRCLEGHLARSSARNGFVATSSPSVVGGPWPDRRSSLAGSARRAPRSMRSASRGRRTGSPFARSSPRTARRRRTGSRPRRTRDGRASDPERE